MNMPQPVFTKCKQYLQNLRILVRYNKVNATFAAAYFCLLSKTRLQWTCYGTTVFNSHIIFVISMT